MSGETVLRYRPVHIRHIVDSPQGTPGAVQVLGRWMAPTSRVGVNGQGGFINGQIEDRVLEHGAGKVTFPHAPGPDGRLHLDRFRCLGSTADAYAPGDEWIEVYEGPFPLGKLIAVLTPTDANVTRGGTIELECVDALWLLNKVRETTVGYWTHAPRDVIEHYSGVWRTMYAEDFDGYPDAASIPGFSTNGATITPGGLRVGSTARCLVPLPAGASGGSWRVEATILFVATGNARHRVGMFKDFDPNFELNTDTGPGVAINDTGNQNWRKEGGPRQSTLAERRVGGVAIIAIEQRNRWTFLYIDGRLVDVSFSSQVAPMFFWVRAGNQNTADFIELQSLLIRQHVPFLMRGTDRGDYRLPGAPPPGGLAGEYFDDADIQGDTDRVLSPVREPYARRLDPQLNWVPGATPPTFQPAGPSGGNNFSVRWAGSVYLDLESSDRTVSFHGGSDPGIRTQIWIAGFLVIDFNAVSAPQIFAAAMSTYLGAVKGWYPIVIETSHRTGAGGFGLYDQTGSAYSEARQIIPSTRLSPLGVYNDLVRFDAHLDAIEKVTASSGHQYRLEPKQLESGLFPGQLAPRVRVGRDTAHVLGEDTASQPSVKLSAQEVAHTMLIDGAGISDQDNAAQLTREAVDFDAVGAHLITHQGMENLAELQAPGLLEQRASSLLALLSSPWEEVTARDLGDDGDPRAAFQLAGPLAALQVGDGVRLQLPSVGVFDATPRQILGRTRTFAPDGASVPVAQFRQRPRSFRDTLRRILKTAVAPQRNYQGTLTTVQGSIGANNSAAPDIYTRAAISLDLADLVSAELIVLYKADASAMTVNVNGSSIGKTVTGVQRVDVTAYARKAAAGDNRCYCHLTGGTGLVEYQLELTVRI